MTKILIAAPVRQSEKVFREYLESLDRLRIPKDAVVDRAFFLHGCPELRPLLRREDAVFYNSADSDYQAADETHRWSGSALSQVAEMKNALLQLCQSAGYDYIFFVDSDLILHPTTLEVLLGREKDICAEIFWTRWQDGAGELMPNCWDYDFYSFVDGAARYRKSGCVETGGTGACILISRRVIDAGVNYDPIKNLPMTQWEDRAFCIRAICAGFDIFIDTTRPARHLYREAEYERYLQLKKARTRHDTDET
ncbi:MAG: glycosyltransferase [Clostridia bacterium]|nr:glycosyltransferase [Clostridia bacterium]